MRQHIARASNTGWETWRSIERTTPKVKIEIDVRVLYAREILTRVLRLAKLLREMGGQGRNRTADAGLFRAALYQLSYLANGLERARSIGSWEKNCQLWAKIETLSY